MEAQKLKLAVFISGGGTNLQALIDACRNPGFPAEIVVVISNNPQAYGLERAQNAGIATEVVNHKDFGSREAFDLALLNKLNDYPVDLVCLAGFMRILTPSFTAQWQDRIINTHPAPLPKHGGKGLYGGYVHRSVLASRDQESGVSIHYVTAECDQGPVILQRRVPVLPDDTEETLAARVLEQEHIAYPEAIERLAARLKKT